MECRIIKFHPNKGVVYCFGSFSNNVVIPNEKKPIESGFFILKGERTKNPLMVSEIRKITPHYENDGDHAKDDDGLLVHHWSDDATEKARHDAFHEVKLRQKGMLELHQKIDGVIELAYPRFNDTDFFETGLGLKESGEKKIRDYYETCKNLLSSWFAFINNLPNEDVFYKYVKLDIRQKGLRDYSCDFSEESTGSINVHSHGIMCDPVQKEVFVEYNVQVLSKYQNGDAISVHEMFALWGSCPFDDFGTGIIVIDKDNDVVGVRINGTIYSRRYGHWGGEDEQEE